MRDDELDTQLLNLFSARQRETLPDQVFMQRLTHELGRDRRLHRAALPFLPRTPWARILRSALAPLKVSPIGCACGGVFLALALLLMKPP